MFSNDSFLRRHKVLSSLALVMLLAVTFLGCRLQGPYRSYKVDFVKPEPGAGEAPGVLEVGVAKRDITPDMSKLDTWNDNNGNNRYEPDNEPTPDTYNDLNENGKFDAAWLAGFNHNRPAQGVHDKIWARAIAVRNNGVTLVMVSTDTIGMFIENTIQVRKAVDPELDIDHILFSSKHIHEVPDTMGLWSYPIPVFSQDKDYLAQVNNACKEAVEEAVANLAQADMICAQKLLPSEGFLDDSRKPVVVDERLSCFRFVKHGTDDTIATVVCWGNHPETMGGNCPLITADFCHYLREGLEKGVPEPNGVEGFGGMCLYFQGLVGGLMTQLHTTVPHRNGEEEFRQASWEKTEALGQNLAIECANLLRSDSAWRNEEPKVAVAAKTIYLPIDGLFHLGIALGLVHPGWYWGKARTEVNVVRIGDVEILTAPGELYPEVAVGGIEAKPGRDYPIEPLEVPPLYSQMTGKMNLMIGLANDEIGYMVPKSQWDAEAPFVYNNKDQYGEENSPGPDATAVYHKEALALLERMHAAL